MGLGATNVVRWASPSSNPMLWLFLKKPLIWVWINTYRYILVGWTSIYQLFWCSPGLHGFDPFPYRNPDFCKYWIYSAIYMNIFESHFRNIRACYIVGQYPMLCWWYTSIIAWRVQTRKRIPRYARKSVAERSRFQTLHLTRWAKNYWFRRNIKYSHLYPKALPTNITVKSPHLRWRLDLPWDVTEKTGT